MNKTRILGIVVGAILVVAVVLTALGFNVAPSALGRKALGLGIGDLHRLEQNQALADRSGQTISQSYSGMGDLRRFDARSNNSSYAGFGDLRRLEWHEANVKTSVNSTGFGDLRRYEAQQANRLGANLPQGSCPNSSTSTGERDAGASAPVQVLLAQGCPVGADH